MQTAFAVFPAAPAELGAVFDQTTKLGPSVAGRRLTTWAQIDIAGRFIVDGILQKLDTTDFVVADVTKLNFNVFFEIGYAIGRGKRLLLTANSSLNPETKELQRLGLFDTIGWSSYSNAAQLASILAKATSTEPIKFPSYSVDRNAPIFVVDTLHKTDASLRTVSRIKKSRVGFRSFDPAEQPRLSTSDAFKGVAKSVAIVAHLLSSRSTNYRDNNLRVAFVAGLGYGLERDCLLFQDGSDEPVPLDYRDLVSVIKHPTDVDRPIADLVPKVTEKALAAESAAPSPINGLLSRLDLGASAAENESVVLGNYYVPTDHYNQALNGNVRLVVGRKGSGKTALFFQVRDKVRSNRKNVVLDLKPEGHQLKRFKEAILQHVSDATQDHLVGAFWEYLLLLEICNKLLEKDRQTHIRDHTIYDKYRRLSDLYSNDSYVSEGDFSERMNRLVARLAEDFESGEATRKLPSLTATEVTNLIYKHDIHTLRRELSEYLQLKNGLWILFDNIDKGWPTRGVQASDIKALRGLLDAMRKLEQSFRKDHVGVRTMVFVRNDVYELLVEETADRGKEAKVSLDWTDRDLLKEVVRRRLLQNDVFEKDLSFPEVWSKVCASHVKGEDSAEFVVERSLMRPRNFINLVNYCKTVAVNLKHDKISEDDILKAVRLYSADLGNEVGLEIRDVFPEADDLLYVFIGCSPRMTLAEVFSKLETAGIAPERRAEVTEILLWFSFLGATRMGSGEEEGTFIYDVYYDMKKLKMLAGNLVNLDATLLVHKAFWSFLDIPDP